MATRKDTAEFIRTRRGLPERFASRAMFGEYALYADGMPVAFLCDDQLYVKILPESAELGPLCECAPAYPGSKDHYLVPEAVIA